MKENSLPQLIIKIFTIDSNRSYRFFFILLIVFVTSLSLILVNIGSPPIKAMPWDVMITLDGGWRIINGQTPHVDFSSPLGPLFILLTAFGMKVAPPSSSSITYGSVLLFIILTPWAWFIGRSRLSSVNAFLFALFMGFLLVAPRALGDTIQNTSYAMLYNRQGFVLLSMLLVELFISPRASVRSKNLLLGGLSSGILLALLLFCKINYFGIGAVAVLVSILLFRCPLMWFTTFASGFLFICIAMQAFFNINLLSLISDVNFASRVLSISHRLTRFGKIFLLAFPHIYLLFFALLVSSNSISKNKSNKDGKFLQNKVLIIIPFVVLSGLLICTTNAQWTDIPLFFIAGLILLECLRREVKLSGDSISSISGLNYLWAVLIIIPFFCGSILLKDIESVAYSAAWNKFKLPTTSESQRFQSRTLYDLVVPENSDNGSSNENVRVASEYPGIVNDGLVMLRKNMSTESRIFSMSFSNPFPFALELPPPRGDASWWHGGKSFNRNYFPDADQVFKNVDMVMVPKFADSQLQRRSEATELMKEIYGGYLKSHFIEKDSSQFWTLLVKR